MLRQAPLPSPVKIPAILVRLSELLPSRNLLSRTGKPWAKDIVKLTFQGLEVPSKRPAQISQTSQSQPPATPAITQDLNTNDSQRLPADETALMVTEARMVIPYPQALSTLKERVDQDIAFDAKTGVFAFRLRSKVGQSVVPMLIERLMRIERLVDFVEVVRRYEDVLKCETISLSKIVFTYSDLSQAQSSEEGKLKNEAPSNYVAIIDFSAIDSTMRLTLETGNPHLRILDSLINVLNTTKGLDSVARLLPLTLPLLRALDSIERTWSSLAARGEVLIFTKSQHAYTVRYNLYIPPSSSENAPVQGQAQQQHQPRKVMLEIRLQDRKGEPWWYIRRTDARDSQVDPIDRALAKEVWDAESGNGRAWKGMRVCAVAKSEGVQDLMGRVDEVLRTVDVTELAVAASPAAQTRAQVQAPVQMQPQRQPPPLQQQPQQTRILPPGMAQAMNQQRAAMKAREVVEID